MAKIVNKSSVWFSLACQGPWGSYWNKDASFGNANNAYLIIFSALYTYIWLIWENESLLLRCKAFLENGKC